MSLQINVIKELVIKNYGKHNVLNALAGIIVYLFKGGKKESLHNALQFNEGVQRRELNYLSVHKAKIILQLKDNETGEIHLHNLEYLANDAQNLVLKGGG